MKKFLAMLLAIMMVMSCTVAMADTATTNANTQSTLSGNDRDKNDGVAIAPITDAIVFDKGSQDGDADSTDNSSLQVKDVISRFKQEDGTQGEVDTELWLQVAAHGQIDVTVPLVLVFSTNIDGGDAMVANNYKIINNNTRNSISVDKIEVEVEDNNTASGTNEADMELVEYDAAGWSDASIRDQYMVILQPEYVGTDANNINDSNITMYDLYDVKTNGDTYDKTDDADSDANKDAVLFQIAQGGAINMKPYMTTTPLTFVTAKKDEGGSEIAEAKGVKLLTITYTVGLKYNVVESHEITTDSELLHDGNVADHTKDHTDTTTP